MFAHKGGTQYTGAIASHSIENIPQKVRDTGESKWKYSYSRPNIYSNDDVIRSWNRNTIRILVCAFIHPNNEVPDGKYGV